MNDKTTERNFERLASVINKNLLSKQINKKTVKAILSEAISNNALTETETGHLKLTPKPQTYCWVYNNQGANFYEPNCAYLFSFLYQIIYEQSRIPVACGNCYKIKIRVDTLGGLLELKKITSGIPCLSKFGCEFDNPYSQSIWSCLFYTSGLESAHQIYDKLSNILCDYPELKKQLEISIKRGCTDYEIAHGPSAQWHFDLKKVEFEDSLRQLFQSSSNKESCHTVYCRWIKIAYQIGDNSYLQLTGGKPLYPKTWDYLTQR